jgi:hypothetical protein
MAWSSRLIIPAGIHLGCLYRPRKAGKPGKECGCRNFPVYSARGDFAGEEAVGAEARDGPTEIAAPDGGTALATTSG